MRNVLAFVNQRLSHQPEESDVVHDLLAFLAKEMVRLNKEKYATQKEFLDWLVSILRVQPTNDGKIGIDALTGKSKLEDYPGDYQKDDPHVPPDELLDILRKNKARLGVRLTDPGLETTLRDAYEASLARVLPLKVALARTDRLIDQIVYRLYGLTDEDIAVVEGRS